MPSPSLLVEAQRLARFAVVGVAATLSHYAVALPLASGLGAPLQLAHVLGFLTAMPLSFLGHYHWTFKSAAGHYRAAVRFVAVATAAFLLSALALQTLSAFTAWEAAAKLLVCVLIIPVASYVLSRVFVF